MRTVGWLAVFVILALATINYAEAADQPLSVTDEAAARGGIQEALDAVVLSSAKYLQENNHDPLNLTPALYEEVRHWASIVKVSVRHNFNNLTISKLGTVHRSGDIGMDPLTGSGNATFTIPLELIEPHVMGNFLFKLSGVGPTGEFDSTIGVYKLEAEGTASVTHNACSVQFDRVHEIEIGQVETKMQGATVFLNAPLAPLVNSDIGKGKLGFQSKVNEVLLQTLQEQASRLDCTPIIQRHIRNSATH